jgi:hypothetical protein
MTNLETAVNHILPERRMKIAEIDKLNDPFEFMGVQLTGTKERSIFKILHRHWSNSIGVICMGKHWKSPLMWAHYAKNHSGVCLGFDIPDPMARQMNYEQERLSVQIDKTKLNGGITAEILEKVLTTKYAQWAYEEEWRLFVRLNDRDPNSGYFYLPFGESLSLREIIVGARCEKPIGSFKKVLGQIDQSVTITKARASFDTFTIVRQKRVSPITVYPNK